MCYYIGSISFKAGIISFLSYSFIGIGIPLIFSKKVDKISILYRKRTGEMNSYMLMSLRGLNEILQFLNGEKRLNEIVRKSEELSQLKIQFSKIEQVQIALTSVIVLVCSYGIFYLLLMDNNYNLYEIIMPMVCLISSFGPVIALSNLSTGLGQTLACGK
jgi:ABC-type multidrug transport system fused ATPase/permease subunit